MTLDFQQGLEPALQNSLFVDPVTQRNLQRLRELCVRYSELGRMAGVEILPYRGGSNERFKTLPLPHQQGIIAHLEQCIELCQSALRSEISIESDSLPFVWLNLRVAGLRPLSDVFGSLEDGDIIELYDEYDRQFFRTFNMFECLSYSLEEIFSFEWFELFDRDPCITAQIREGTQAILRGDAKTTVMVNGPIHLIGEKFSSRRKQARIQTKLLSPLFREDGKIGGYVSCTKLIELLEGPNRKEEELSQQAAVPVPLRSPARGE